MSFQDLENGINSWSSGPHFTVLNPTHFSATGYTESQPCKPFKPSKVEKKRQQPKYNLDEFVEEIDNFFDEILATKAYVQNNKNPKGTDMSANFEVQARNYLRDRLSDVDWEKRAELRTLYDLENNGEPKTIKDLVDRIKSGSYKVSKDVARFEEDTGEEFKGSPHFLLRHFEWDNGDYKDRQKKFNDAYAAFVKEWQRTRDVIAVSPPEKALEAFQALQAWKPAS